VPQSSVVASWELAIRLRQRREQMGIDAGELAKQMGFTRNYWSAVENERKVLSKESLTNVVGLLEFDESEHQKLEELREITKMQGWWTEYSGLLDSSLQRLYGLEYDARSVRTYESLLVPGLLQTTEYARAIMAPDPTVRRTDVDPLVDVRMRRQERLSGPDPFQLTALISQAVLWQQIGGPDVLASQLRHLAAMIERYPDSIDVRVIPFTVTSCPLFGSATFEILTFASSILPTVAWHETVTAQDIISDAARVRDIDKAFSETLRLSLNQQESFDLIGDRIKELD
jgi:transcriptional regulator with XRE-family HTH domain